MFFFMRTPPLNHDTILGFNEPNFGEQANMAPRQAAEYWIQVHWYRIQDICTGYWIQVQDTGTSAKYWRLHGRGCFSYVMFTGQGYRYRI